MRRSIILICCTSISFGSVTKFVRCQAPEKKRDSWIEVLQNDPRLKVPISFKSTSAPTARELFNILQKATGVSLSLAGQAEKGNAAFGSTTIVNVPAWKVMERLAATQLTDGRWEKSGDGYVLHGKPREFYDRPPPDKAIAAPKPDLKTKANEPAAGDGADKSSKSDPFYLRRDPRLNAKLRLVEVSPSLHSVLGRLESATGLKITVDDALASHQPDLGDMQLPDVHAWGVMELIAKAQLAEGRWDKTATGYRLMGSSTVPAPVLTADSRMTVAFIALAVILALLAFHLTISVLALFRAKKPLVG